MMDDNYVGEEIDEPEDDNWKYKHKPTKCPKCGSDFSVVEHGCPKEASRIFQIKPWASQEMKDWYFGFCRETKPHTHFQCSNANCITYIYHEGWPHKTWKPYRFVKYK